MTLSPELRPVGIGRPAELTGASVRALRYYQEVGLLTPSCTGGGARRSAPDDLARVRRIRELQEVLGFQLEEIRPVLADEDQVAALCAHAPSDCGCVATATVFGSDAYPTFIDKAAALMHSLARTHALVDGNKRLAWSATRAFCLLNGRDLRSAVDDAEQVVVAVAAGTRDVADLAAWIEAHLIDAPSD